MALRCQSRNYQQEWNRRARGTHKFGVCYFCFVFSNKNNNCNKNNNNNNNNNNTNGKVFETNLNGGNIIKQMSIWEVSLLRYSAAFIYWNCEELIQLDRRTRKS